LICDDGPCDDPAVTGSFVPYLVGGAIAAGLFWSEDWLQRRTGQSWWAVDQLVWAVLSALLAVVLAYSGHLLGALVLAALVLFEVGSARRNWTRRGSRNLLEENRMELEHPVTASRNTAARSTPSLGVGGWIFVFGIVGVWSLLEHWGLSWISAGVVAAVIAVVAFRLTRRRSSDPVRWNGEERWVADDGEHIPRSVGHDHDQRADGAAREHEVHFTVSGRPARLIGRLLERLTRPTDTRDG
jgi:hypothetical protein